MVDRHQSSTLILCSNITLKAIPSLVCTTPIVDYQSTCNPVTQHLVNTIIVSSQKAVAVCQMVSHAFLSIVREGIVAKIDQFGCWLHLPSRVCLEVHSQKLQLNYDSG